MLSAMERDAHEAQDEAERAVASLWIDYPPTPWWWFVAPGLWAAAMVFTFAEAIGRLWFSPLLVGVLIFLELYAFGWMQQQRGSWPTLRSAPPEFRPGIRRYFVGVGILFVAIVAVCVTVGTFAAMALAAFGVNTGLAVYEKAYETAARATRERLS